MYGGTTVTCVTLTARIPDHLAESLARASTRSRLTEGHPPKYDGYMERRVDLGRALAQLRSLLGLSLDACAGRLGIATERLLAAERGDIDYAALEGIAKLYAFDEEQLGEGMIIPLEGVEGSTVFLLHGARQDFDATDLGVLDRAMRAARLMTSLSIASDESLRRRIQFAPAPPAGPRPADAARQGYRFARLVRAKLELGGEPIEDMRSLLEEKFGIAVVVDNLVSTDLRAASILDAHRAAAAAVLASHHPDRDTNPTLARVYLAHELCHLLFDPGAPGSVRLALDDRLTEHPNRSGAAAGGNALLESRAKGFAAEFLIPLNGVTALLGAATGQVSLDVARTMVIKVREHFGTSWDIATFHLHNLGFIQKELKFELQRDKPSTPSVRYITSLPSAGATPLRLEELLAVQAAQPAPKLTTRELSSTTADVTPTPPWYVAAAQSAAVMAMDELSAEAIEAAAHAVEHGRELDAVDLLVEHFDELFLAGEFEAARRMFPRLDPQKLTPKVLTGVLMVSAHAREELGEARVEFFARAQSALAEKWKLSSETIQSVVRRLT